MISKANVHATWNYILKDHDSWPLRFWFEVAAWILSIACSVIMMITLPNPPFAILYFMWITGCGIYAWAAWTRESFGMLANYLLLTTIDTLALIRILL